jgi:hypothetical protein
VIVILQVDLHPVDLAAELIVFGVIVRGNGRAGASSRMPSGLATGVDSEARDVRLRAAIPGSRRSASGPQPACRSELPLCDLSRLTPVSASGRPAPGPPIPDYREHARRGSRRRLKQ